MMDGAMGMMGSERPMGMSSKDADAVAHASMQEMMANMKDFKVNADDPANVHQCPKGNPEDTGR